MSCAKKIAYAVQSCLVLKALECLHTLDLDKKRGHTHPQGQTCKESAETQLADILQLVVLDSLHVVPKESLPHQHADQNVIRPLSSHQPQP